MEHCLRIGTRGAAQCAERTLITPQHLELSTPDPWRVEMSKRAVIIPFVMLGVAATLLFTINGCWTSWEGGKAEQRTDDAYVRADMTPLSTRISGTVRKIDVDDFEAV